MKHNISDWKLTEDTTEYENEYFAVTKQQLVQPNGKNKIYYVIKRPYPFSIVIPLTDKSHTYLIGQYRVPTQTVSWEFPMGGVPDKKNPLEIAQQELKEETGFTARTWKEIGLFYPVGGVMNQRGYVYVASDLEPGPSAPESGEFLELQIVPLSDIPLLIKNKTITDGPTIVAYQYYLLDASSSA